MRANGMVEMDSYRLAAYTVPCPCYICGGGNNFDAELCRHCHAPMALAHQANIAKDPSANDRRHRSIGSRQDRLSRHARRHALAAGRAASAPRSRCVFDPPAAERDGLLWLAASFPAKRRTSPTAGTGSIARSFAKNTSRPS